MLLNVAFMKTDNDVFSPGVEVNYTYYSGEVVYGVINFIDDIYLTLCVKRGEHKSCDVLVVVPRSNWNNIEPLFPIDDDKK